MSKTISLPFGPDDVLRAAQQPRPANAIGIIRRERDGYRAWVAVGGDEIAIGDARPGQDGAVYLAHAALALFRAAGAETGLVRLAEEPREVVATDHTEDSLAMVEPAPAPAQRWRCEDLPPGLASRWYCEKCGRADLHPHELRRFVGGAWEHGQRCGPCLPILDAQPAGAAP